jgi:hypothetical protein
MRVRIVCYEEVDRWIMGKFARRMRENLDKMGIQADIAMTPDDTADINHHIVFGGYDGKEHGIDTVMITHIDNIDKLEQVKEQLTVAKAGICMSKQTQLYLAQMGIDNSKLCYVNPAHDEVVAVRKIVVGITCRVQEDGRKREKFLVSLASKLDSRFFKFVIMGDSWEEQVERLLKLGFEVNYTSYFMYEEYVKLIPTLDYYLYMGMDEGQMGFVDALAAGVKTIVTAQGYHLDAKNGITHPFTTYAELERIFLDLQNEKRKLVDAVTTWNWHDYTLKHVEIWHYLMSGKARHSKFSDGVNSLLDFKKHKPVLDPETIHERRKQLQKNKYSHYYSEKKNKLKRAYRTKGIDGILKLIRKKIFNNIKPR